MNFGTVMTCFFIKFTAFQLKLFANNATKFQKMKKNLNSKPIMMYVAEEIYIEVSKIKEKNVTISNIDAIEIYIGSKHCNKISNGKFHEELLINLTQKKLLNDETTKLLEIQKKTVMEKLSTNKSTYYAKSSYPLSNSQNAIGLIWRMCESYELWCKESGENKKIVLKLIG